MPFMHKSKYYMTVQWETFKGENFHKFHGFVTISEIFLKEMFGAWQI